MIILNWNISYGCNIEKICNELKNITKEDKTIVVTLQEVVESSFKYLEKMLQNDFNVIYSLNFRKPGKYDTKSRKLGTLIMTTKNIKIIESNVFNRCLLPERTLYATIEIDNKIIKVVTLHSITGCAHKKAKSLQFYSFAEVVDDYKPDILTIDANEPDIDHFDIDNMKFFDNGDKGNGAKTFFNTCKSVGLIDSYTKFYNKTNFEYGQPVVVSHVIGSNRKIDVHKNKRYDFIFINDNKLNMKQVDYEMMKANMATSDHAYIKCKI